MTNLRTAAKCDLLAEAARKFGEVRLAVTGISMLPALWPGDIVTVRNQHITELLPGQIAQLIQDGQMVSHRVVRNCGDHIVTRGDAVGWEDAPAFEHEIVGRVVSIAREGRSIDPRPVLWGRWLAWILRRSRVAVWVTMGVHRRVCEAASLGGVRKIGDTAGDVRSGTVCGRSPAMSPIFLSQTASLRSTQEGE